MAQLIPKPGDNVLIVSTLDPEYGDEVGKVFRVVDCPDLWKNSPKYNQKIWVNYMTNSCCTPVCDIAMLHARPGDTIDITWPNQQWNGKRFKVIACPVEFVTDNAPGDAWFRDENGEECFFRPNRYVVVELGSGGIEDVDTSLKKQRDDNLRSVFG